MLAPVDEAEVQQSAEAERAHRPALIDAPPERVADQGPQAAAERLASAIGNQGMTQVVARMQDGQGLLPDGTVHTDVASTIDAMAGGGRRLDGQLLEALRPSHGDLSDARIHTGPEAEQLARAVSAKAFTVGTDIFMGAGGETDFELVAHEA